MKYEPPPSGNTGAEETPRASERLFATFMQNLPGLAWIKDLEGRYVYVNAAAERAFGRTKAELYGHTDDEIFPPQTAALFRDNDRTALAREDGVETVEALEHEDGIHHSIVSKFPIPGPDGKPALIGGMAIDITARKVAGAALRESEARFRHMADNVPVLIWMNGLDGCEFVNREYLRFVGRSLDGVLGMRWNEFIHPDDVEDYMRDYLVAFEARRPYESQCRLLRADGVYRWVQSNGVPRFAPDGAFLGYVGSSVDITEIKQSQDALKEADRRKDEFLATLAHELRNPLAPIRNSLRLMRLAGDDPATVERARSTMERQLHQMVRLVDDLLDVSRISRGKIELRKERVDLADVVRDAVETSRPVVEEAAHDLIVSLPVDPIFVDADMTRLAQVFANLLNNAAKFTERGGHIALAVERHGDAVAVSVRDDGAGIAREMLPRVFELFTQGDRSLEKTQGGLGIGLTIVRQLVEMHGGTVEALSDGPGTGSEFVVRLPVHAAQAPEPRPAERDDEHAAAPVTRRVLVADDNEDSATSLALLLEMLGNEVRTACNGLEAVEVATAFQPHAILLDIGMPKLNGYDACRRIREQPWGGAVVIIAMTGWGQDEDKRRSREAGFDHHLVKPVEPVAVERLLGERR